MFRVDAALVDERWPLVARDDELDRCRRLLADDRGVLLAGPAGVGKTRLARELADGVEMTRTVVRVAASALTIPLSALTTTDGGDEAPIVVLDDVHELDDDAAALVLRLVMQDEIVLVGTLRTGESPPAAATVLWKDDHVARLDLEPLERAQVHELLDAVLAGPIDAATRRQLWEATHGSPLMLRELLRSSLDDGTLAPVDGLWSLSRAPRSLRLDELVVTRLDVLAADVRRVVELVALGEPVGFEQLAAAVGLAALAEAEATGLVEAVTDGLRREVRMTHPVFADATRRATGEARTVEHCADLVAFLDQTPMHRRDDVVRSVLWQLRRGGTVMTSDMVLAARRALYDRQDQLAIDLATRAFSGDAESGLILGAALSGRGDHARADQLMRDVSAGRSPADIALLANKRADVMFWGLGKVDETESLLLAAEQEVPEGRWRDVITATRAVMASNLGRVQEALALAEPILERHDGEPAFVTASVAAVASLALSGRGDEAKSLASAAYDECERIGERLALPDPGLFVVLGTMASKELGELAEAETTSRFVYDLTVADGRREGQAWSSLTLGDALLVQGRLTEARERFGEAAGVFASLHHVGPRRWALAGAVMCAAALGNADSTDGAWNELLGIPEHPAAMMASDVVRARAWWRLAQGDREGAIADLRTAADDARASGAFVLIGSVLHDIVRLGGSTTEQEWTEVRSCAGALPAARVAFADATRRGDGDGLLEVAGRFADIGADLFAAEAALSAADLFAAEGASRPAARARRIASDAQNRTGEDWFATLDRAPAAIELTDRELDVAKRAADSMTSREIADELGISVRTVDNHLQRVYAKLGIAGRRELTTAIVLS